MTRLLGRHISHEMVALWLFELGLSVLAIDFVVGGFASVAPGGRALRSVAADHAAVFGLTIALTSLALGLYRSEICFETRRLVVSTIASGVIAFPALLLVGSAVGIDFDILVGPDALWPGKVLIAWLGCLVVTRLLLRVALRNNILSRRLVVVGSPDRAAEVVDAIGARRLGFFTLANRARAPSELRPTALRRAHIWGVVIADDMRDPAVTETLLSCQSAGVRIIDGSDFRERQLRRVDLDSLRSDWLLDARAMQCGRVEAALRRCGDVALASAVLLVTLPLMLVTALIIRIDSRGPVLYRQERVGLHGRGFTLLKFRSMTVDAEATGGPIWAQQRDPRVTRVGAFLRKCRIDELPQLFNVLSGEMGFIGPRPERPHFVEKLAAVIPGYRDRAVVKPGITGWAQVNFPYGASVEDARMKLAYDLYYIRHRSLLLDVMTLFATVRVILFQEGAR